MRRSWPIDDEGLRRRVGDPGGQRGSALSTDTRTSREFCTGSTVSAPRNAPTTASRPSISGSRGRRRGQLAVAGDDAADEAFAAAGRGCASSVAAPVPARAAARRVGSGRAAGRRSRVRRASGCAATRTGSSGPVYSSPESWSKSTLPPLLKSTMRAGARSICSTAVARYVGRSRKVLMPAMVVATSDDQQQGPLVLEDHAAAGR